MRLNLNTDDAGICSTDILKEYQFAINAFGFQRAELIDISMMAIEASFVAKDIQKGFWKKYTQQLSVMMLIFLLLHRSPFILQRFARDLPEDTNNLHQPDNYNRGRS